MFTAEPPHVSEYAEKKRTKQNLIVCSGKSDAKVTNNRRLCSAYYTERTILKLTDDRHET